MPDHPVQVSLVTGGAGFIGSHLVDRLLERGDRVVVVDDLSSGKLQRVSDDARFEQLDVTDTAAMLALVAETKPDHCFHLAAQADVRVSVQDPIEDARVNVLGTISMIKVAERTGTPIVFASTGGAIYGSDGEIPTPEGAEEQPLSPYGAAKLAAEKYLLMHGRLRGMRHAILRFANVYGPRQDPHGEAGVVAIFGGRLLRAEGVTVYGDGSQTRDYVYVDDVVDALVAAGDLVTVPGPVLRPLNIGVGYETSVNELLATMQEIAGTSIEATLAPPREGELSRSALAVERAREVLGVALETPLRTGLERTLEAIRAEQLASTSTATRSTV